MKKDFKEIVQAMSAKEIIMAVVEGLKNPYTKINMNTYGYSDGGLCYGCAATNTICAIVGALPELPLKLSPRVHESGFSNSGLSTDGLFVRVFENSINCLREGGVRDYNYFASIAGFAIINDNDRLNLPPLSDDYTEADLLPFIELANRQPTNP